MDKQQILAQQNVPWWQATEEDNFDVSAKLRRLGCRPLKRMYLSCKQQERLSDHTISCTELNDELERCSRLVQYLNSSYSQTSPRPSLP